jgi:hypothetical protein
MGVAATGSSSQVTYHGRASRYSRDAVASGPEMLAAVQAPIITLDVAWTTFCQVKIARAPHRPSEAGILT